MIVPISIIASCAFPAQKSLVSRYKLYSIVGGAIAIIALVVGLALTSPELFGIEERPTVWDLTITNRQLKPNIIEVTAGETITLRITSDEEGEFHIHTYEAEVELEPGETAILRFKADIQGRFNLEFHKDDEEFVIGNILVLPR